MNASRKDHLERKLGVHEFQTKEPDFATTTLKTLVDRRGFSARDPRDSIFAHLELCTSGIEDFPEKLVPDYTKTVKQVYEEVTIHLLTALFDVLAHKEEVELSLQTADWPHAQHDVRLLDHSLRDPIKELIAPSILACYRFIMSPIMSVTGMMNPTEGGLWDAFLDAETGHYSAEELESTSSRRFTIPFPNFQHIENWHEGMQVMEGRRFTQLLPLSEEEEEVVGDVKDAEVDSDSDSSSTDNIPSPSAIKGNANLSKNEHLLVPGSTRPGDIVCLLGAATKPFILRPHVPDPAIAESARKRVGDLGFPSLWRIEPRKAFYCCWGIFYSLFWAYERISLEKRECARGVRAAASMCVCASLITDHFQGGGVMIRSH
ncbi:uncharacterized protein PAC_03676 [Phialocephala subalpina]|uniref:Uncharacterized protein n=1 Tax=Phialocephala subalpina TaxID=576137 RepID=A0A1L7WM23_9HELO|nr:uncharacterized protein PAC_03676 [Phialocephala subalpina]